MDHFIIEPALDLISRLLDEHSELRKKDVFVWQNTNSLRLGRLGALWISLLSLESNRRTYPKLRNGLTKLFSRVDPLFLIETTQEISTQQARTITMQTYRLIEENFARNNLEGSYSSQILLDKMQLFIEGEEQRPFSESFLIGRLTLKKVSRLAKQLENVILGANKIQERVYLGILKELKAEYESLVNAYDAHSQTLAN